MRFLKILSALIFAILPTLTNAQMPKIKLGIDVLSDMNFSPIKGKRVGLLTHPAGVNRWGKSTVDILYKAKNVNLTTLYGPEHGIYGNEKADVPVLDNIDPRTKLPVYSLYGKYRKPTPQMLKNIDVLVIDLQDVGSRSYTYISCMLRAMEACFENGKEVMILDRPNPLGGLKVDGPPLDKQFKSYVGMFKVPYVHGLTIGELAKFAKATSGAMEITSKEQKNGRLTVIPMQGWKRSMMWTDTGLRWKQTSPAVPNFPAVVGYAMNGLGCQIGGFQHGYGSKYPFRLITFPSKNSAQIESALRKKKIAGLEYERVQIKDFKGKPLDGVYVIVKDWANLRPTEISFHLMTISCEFNGGNMFKNASKTQASLFNKHTGSEAWWNELCKKGAKADVKGYIEKWSKQAREFQKHSKKFYIYQ